jgi:hypothetical protein
MTGRDELGIPVCWPCDGKGWQPPTGWRPTLPAREFPTVSCEWCLGTGMSDVLTDYGIETWPTR